MEIDNAKSGFKKCLLKLKKFLFKEITSYSMRYNYNHSDVYMVLSASFIDVFKKFAKVKNPKHLVVQTNPVTIDSKGFEYDNEKKVKEILYVGRIDTQQKRVDRVIDTWSKLYKKHPNWRLTIIGGGDGREELESIVAERQIPRVSFEGFRNPLEYYKRASLLILTSEYEGFGLVVVEAMCFGVVPVVFGSYPAIFDIIVDGKDGRIVKPVDGEFSVSDMAAALEQYMNDGTLLSNTAIAAINKSTRFSTDTIAAQWNKVFVNLCKSVGGINKSFLDFIDPYRIGILPYNTDAFRKEKEVLFVGRIDKTQKRVDRIIETWSQLESIYSNWRLTIVGDGPDRDSIDSLARDKGLARISFEGFRSPVAYYKRASVLVLTSEFEGFPLVLAECMSFGVVPVVYDSYPAVRDIINNGVNGLIVEPRQGGFAAEDMAAAMDRLMRDDSLRQKMAKEAIKTSEKYSINNIYRKWMKVLSELVDSDNDD